MPKISKIQGLEEKLKEQEKLIRKIKKELRIVRKERDMAETDHVTGFPSYNRLTAKKMQQLVDQSERTNLTVLICYFDINDFTSINDNFGHHAGDVALHHIAHSIKKCLRSKFDYLVRKGGDEFIALMIFKEEPTHFKLDELKKRFKESVVTTNLEIKGIPVSFSTSVGVKKYDFARTIVEEIGVADDNLYEDKQKEKKTKK